MHNAVVPPSPERGEASMERAFAALDQFLLTHCKAGPHCDAPHKELTAIQDTLADLRAQLAEARERAETRPEIICLCGSSRFIEHFAIFAWELEKGGKIVLSLHLLPLLPRSYPGVSADHQAESEGIAAAMDELHLRKIDLADRVIVMNVGGYIGDSTRREIAYATAHGKPVSYLEPAAARASVSPGRTDTNREKGDG